MSELNRKERVSPREEITALTGLRGIGALMIIVYHLHKMPGTFLEPFVDGAGVVGLMIFFALSGYILSYVHGDDFGPGMPVVANWARFIWKRIARIYPLHLVLLLYVIATYPRFVVPTQSGTRQLLLNLTLTHGWTFDELSFVAASWSISVEFFFYLIFPALLFVRLNVMVAAVAYLGIAIFSTITVLGMLPTAIAPYATQWILWYGVYFVSGMAVYYLTIRVPWIKNLLSRNFAFTGLMAIILLSPLLGYAWTRMICNFAVPLLVGSAHLASLGSKLLGNRALLFIGTISYSLYLSHQLLAWQVSIIAQAGGETNPLYFWGAYYPLLLIWCCISYYFIERGARNMLRSLLGGSSDDEYRVREQFSR